MDSLFLLQFACFIFMLVNAFFVALSHLHVRWKNMRYERLASFTDSPLLSISFHIVLLLSNWIFYSRSKGKEIKKYGQGCIADTLTYNRRVLQTF